MKRLLTVAFILIVASGLMSNHSVMADDGKTTVVGTQLSEGDIEGISEYDKNILNMPILKVYHTIPWHMADKTINEIVAYEERSSYLSSFVVLSDAPYRIYKKSFEKVLFEKVPNYIADIISMGNKVSIKGKESAITGIYCFDENSSHHGIVVAVVTKNETLYRYYEHYYSEGKDFSEKEFGMYAINYYNYITSYDFNYDENGEGKGGAVVTFGEYVVANPVDIEETISDKTGTSFDKRIPIIIGSLFIIMISAVTVMFTQHKKTQSKKYN